MNKGTYIHLSYNTNDREETKWNLYRGTGITLTLDMRSRMTKRGSGGDPQSLVDGYGFVLVVRMISQLYLSLYIAHERV